jgi:Arc/MetJ family transcription regulator
MKITLHIDKSLLNHAIRLTGIDEKVALVRMALEALIRQETALIPATQGIEPQARPAKKVRY